MLYPLAPPRAAERFGLDSIGIIRGADGQVLRTRDLSEHGVFLFSRTPPAFILDLGYTFDLDLYGTTRSLRCRAVVVRIATPSSREGMRHPNGFAARLIYGDRARPAVLDLVREARQARGTTPPALPRMQPPPPPRR